VIIKSVIVAPINQAIRNSKVRFGTIFWASLLPVKPVAGQMAGGSWQQ
jgi:hypothetical protein